MIVGTIQIKLYAPWVHSLKEKRAVVKGLIAKTQRRFNVSIAEIDEQDTLQIIMIGIAFVANSVRFADSVADSVSAFIEQNTEALIVEVHREFK